MLGRADVAQALDDQRCLNAAQVKALAPRNDGRQDLVALRRGEDELHVRRRLFQRLEQRVEGRGGKHVDFVDDDDLEGAVGRGELDLVAQVAHLVHAVVRGPVDFQHIQRVAGRDFAAHAAGTARRGGGTLLAIQRLGEDPRQRGLADAARPDEQIGVRDTAGLDRVLERSRDVLLTDHIIKPLGAPLPC